jgi:hypothetical protein
MHESATATRMVEIAALGERLSALRLCDAEALTTIRRSLEQHGQLAALTLFAEPGGLEIIDGFKRLRAARALGWVTLLARIDDVGPVDAKLRLRELHDRRGLTEIEEAWVVQPSRRSRATLAEEFQVEQDAMRVPIAVRRLVDAGVEPIVVAKTLAIGDRDGGPMYRLSTRAGAFALDMHEAIAVDWSSLAIRDADADLAADVMVSGATWLATQHGIDRELLVNLVTGTPRGRGAPTGAATAWSAWPNTAAWGGRGVDRDGDPAGAAAAIRSAGGRAVPGAAVTAAERYRAFERRWAAIDQLMAGVTPIPWSLPAEVRDGDGSRLEPCDDWAEILVQAATDRRDRGAVRFAARERRGEPDRLARRRCGDADRDGDDPQAGGRRGRATGAGYAVGSGRRTGQDDPHR